MANILAVDDNPDLCILLKTALERDGHRVVTCSSGADLTEALCRWSDCILLDVMMPNESGFAVCRRIREQTDAPILFLTARTDEASVLEGLGIGGDDYLTKPFRVSELRARVAAHLRRQNRVPVYRMVRGGVSFDMKGKSARSTRSVSIWRFMLGRPSPRNKSTKPCLAWMEQRTTPLSPSISKTSGSSCGQQGYRRRC